MKKEIRSELTVENDLMQMELELEDQKTLHRIHQYIAACDITAAEVEGIRKDLIGMANEARSRGESLKNAIGENQKEFCSSIVYAATGKGIPKGRAMLNISGRIWQAWGIINGLTLIWFAFIIVYYGYTTPGTAGNLESIIGLSDLSVWMNLCIGMVQTILIYFAGKYGCKHCASRGKAKTCFYVGIGLTGYALYGFVSECVRMLNHGSLNITSLLLAVFLMASAVCYLGGAQRNIRSDGKEGGQE